MQNPNTIVFQNCTSVFEGPLDQISLLIIEDFHFVHTYLYVGLQCVFSLDTLQTFRHAVFDDLRFHYEWLTRGRRLLGDAAGTWLAQWAAIHPTSDLRTEPALTELAHSLRMCDKYSMDDVYSLYQPLKDACDRPFLVRLREIMACKSGEKIVALIDQAAKQYKVEREHASKIGTDIHKWIELFIKAYIALTPYPELPRTRKYITA